MEVDLPIIEIEGTEFVVNIWRAEITERNNSQNKLSFFEMYDYGEGYTFPYSYEHKNKPGLFERADVIIKIPQMVELDPKGMAQKYKTKVEDIVGKSDFDLMVDPEAFDKRVNEGFLPTIDIAGHIFYVDIRLDMLRPHDDFGSKGIVFSEIDEYYNEDKKLYIIPYNPATHEFQKLDYNTLTEIPKDILVVSFPYEKELDIVGWNRKHDLEITNRLKEIPIKFQLEAKLASWEDLHVPKIIRENLERLKGKNKIEDNASLKITENSPKRKGRKL